MLFKPGLKPIDTLRKANTCFLLLLLAICFSFRLPGGSLIDKLEQQLFAYSQEHPTTNVYLHIDKNIYVAGETIWFKAYLPSTSRLQSEGLYIRIVDQEQHIKLEKEFLVYDIRSNGEIILPDTLKQGTYLLYAYTDKMINFDGHDVFVQQIKVAPNSSSQLKISCLVADTNALQPGKNVDILCNLNRNGQAVQNLKGFYSVITSSNKLVSEGKLVTNSLGNVVLSFAYPDIDSTQHLKLVAHFADGQKNSISSELNLPPSTNYISLKVNAEGGTLVQNVASKILVQTQNASGQPVAAQVKLFRKGVLVSACITNEAGRGVITFKPGITGSYYFVVSRGRHSQKTSLDIPVASAGWCLRMQKDNSGNGVIIHNEGMPPDGLLVLRDLQHIIKYQALRVKSGDSVIVPLPGIDTLKQVLSMAMFDIDGKLSAERLYLTRSEENFHMVIKAEKNTYTARQKVKINLKIIDNNGLPVVGNLSAAAVTAKALDERVYKTILSSGYNLLGGTEHAQTVYNDKEPDFNDALIACHWQHNSWAEVLAYQVNGSIKLIANSAGLTGLVKSKNKKPIALKTLVLMSGRGMKIIDVRDDGTFSIPAKDLVNDELKDNYIIINEGFYDKYTLELKNNITPFDNQVIKSGLLNPLVRFMMATPPFIQPPVNTIQLKEVGVSARRINADSLTYAKLVHNYPANCSDWVCMYGFLNCSLHPYAQYGGARPVIGTVYAGVIANGKPYTKCISCTNCQPTQKNNILISRVNRSHDFALSDYERDSNLPTALLSTIFWNPNINTDKNGVASFEFFTSDLKGRYKIIVQGIDVNTLRPILGMAEINVE